MRKLVFHYLFFLCTTSAFATQPAATTPIPFVQNKGQWAQAALFAAEIPQGWLFLEKDGFTYNFLEPGYFNHEPGPEEKNRAYRGHAFRIKFLQPNPRVQVRGEEKQTDYRNYFIGSDPQKWATGVPVFGEVLYQQVFPHTDLRVYTANQHLKYDYVVQPYGQVSAIRMQYQGAKSLALVDGKLSIKTSVNEILEEAPYAYQMVDGKQQSVACAFTLHEDVVGFEITGNYDPNLPLVIDPAVVFITYTGSTSGMSANCATADALGNTYAAGQSFGPNYPITTGVFQATRSGSNVAICKFNAAGTKLLYASFLGGQSQEYPLGMLVNQQDELVIMGFTMSQAFPTTVTAFDRTLALSQVGSSKDFFISKISADGKTLQASTFLGGSGLEGGISTSDTPGALALDAAGNIIMAGMTQSGDFPMISPLQATKKFGDEGVIVSLNSSLSRVLWSSYFGGNGNDQISDIQIGPVSGKIFITGNTNSSDLPASSDGIRKTYMGGSRDGFVAVLAPAGNQLMACSYFGTDQMDYAQLLALDEAENVYIAGYTAGTYPATAGTATTPNAIGGYFIHKVNSQLSSTSFSIHLGNHSSNFGGQPFIPTAFQVDACGSLYLTAYALSNCPVTPDALEKNRRNLYLCQLSEGAKTLTYGTYFGSSFTGHIHNANHGYVTKKGIFHHIECLSNRTVVATPGAYSAGQTSANDGVISKFHFQPAHLVTAQADYPEIGCTTYAVKFNNASTNASSYAWNFGDGTESTETSPAHTFPNPGNYQVRLIARSSLTCNPADTLYLEVRISDNTPVRARVDLPPSSCAPYNVAFQNKSTNGQTFQWAFGDGTTSNASSPTHLYENPGTYRVRLVASNGGSCNQTDTTVISVVVRKPITVRAISEAPPVGCAPYSVTFPNESTHAATYIWDFGDGTPVSSETTPAHTFQNPGTYRVKLTALSPLSCDPPAVTYLEVQVNRDLIAPNIITPNKDGKNDYLQITNAGPGTRLRVFNRWGKLVYQDDEYAQNWDGEGLSNGTYYFTIEANDACRSIKGWVEIVR